MDKVCKTTAKIPKSRSKYLMQFLQKNEGHMDSSPPVRMEDGHKYTQIYSKIRTTPKLARKSAINRKKELNAADVEMIEDNEEFKTPTNYNSRRRVKKIDQYDEYHNYYNSSPQKYGIESTAYSNGVSANQVMFKNDMSSK